MEVIVTVEALQEAAIARVQEDNQGATNLKVTKAYDNIMNGRLITVSFQTATGSDSNHIYFGPDGMRTYRWHSDVLNAVSYHKERLWFFRFLETVGIGGLIAFLLVIIFSVLLCALAFSTVPTNTAIVDIIKTSFTIILGYFFGKAGGDR